MKPPYYFIIQVPPPFPQGQVSLSCPAVHRHISFTSAKFNHSNQVVFRLYLWFHFPQFTSSQLQSEDIKWKIPEINKS